MENTTDRTSRAAKTRAAKPRRKPWQPPSLLDAPQPPEGFVHRWIRAEVRGLMTEKMFLPDLEKAGNWYEKKSTRTLKLLL